MNREAAFKKIKKKIDKLPIFDSDVFKLTSLLDDQGSDYEKIIEELSPGIATRFLSVANTAYYGQEIKSINHAVRLLGYKGMKDILVASILYDQYYDDIIYCNFNVSKFHLEAKFSVIVSNALGKMLEYNPPENLFTVALLHDIGKLVIAANFLEEIEKINSLKKMHKMPSLDAEMEVLGVPHSIIGAYLLKKMKISKDIYLAVAQHEEKKPKISENVDYGLVLLTRATSMIISRYFLPEENKLQEISDNLITAVSNARNSFKNDLKQAITDNGHLEAYKQQLPLAIKFVFKELGIYLKLRS